MDKILAKMEKVRMEKIMAKMEKIIVLIRRPVASGALSGRKAFYGRAFLSAAR